MTGWTAACIALACAAFIAMCSGHERTGAALTLAALAAFIACALLLIFGN